MVFKDNITTKMTVSEAESRSRGATKNKVLSTISRITQDQRTKSGLSMSTLSKVPVTSATRTEHVPHAIVEDNSESSKRSAKVSSSKHKVANNFDFDIK